MDLIEDLVVDLKGVKGKYKMVDGVMKNEQRALKRIAKKHKK